MSLALPGWLRRPSNRTKDVALAVLVALPVVGTGIGAAIDRSQPLFVLVAVAAIVPFWWRRDHPVAVLAAVLLVGLCMRDLVVVQIAAVVVLYQVAATRPPPTIALGAGAVLAATEVHELAWQSGSFHIGQLGGSAVLCGISVTFGLSVANRRANINTLRERAERLDRERELLAGQAVADERRRIARELHDVVAHNVSLMVVQAQALGATAKEPAVAEATTGIADLGRQAMTEMHRTLELLRDRDGSPGRAPPPGLDGLEELIDQSRRVNAEVELTVEGAPHPLSQSLDLTAYRIVQEGLTNVRKHAPGARTRVTISYGPKALELTIRNGAGDAAVPVTGGGHGITGMRERAALFGGTLDAGPREDGGFGVHAVLPYDENRSG